MKNDFNSEDLQSTPQQQKDTLDVGRKTQTSQSFTISEEEDFNVVVHLEKDDLKNINSIIDKLNHFKNEGFNFISVEKADYKYNTYTDAEYYYTESTNDVFYLAKDKKEIPDKLNSFKLENFSEYNSIDDIKTGVNYTATKIDHLIDILQSKKIFLPREEYCISINPIEIKNFSNLVNKAVDINKVNPKLDKNFDIANKSETKEIAKTPDKEVDQKSSFGKSKVILGLNEVVHHNNQNFEVMALQRKGIFQMKIQETGQVFKLKSTDGLYNSLINAKETSVLAANISKADIQTLKGAEKNEGLSPVHKTDDLYIPEISKSFKR